MSCPRTAGIRQDVGEGETIMGARVHAGVASERVERSKGQDRSKTRPRRELRPVCWTLFIRIPF